MSDNWTYSSLLCFFKKLPQFFPWRNSAKNMGTRVTGKAVKIHISSKMARELIAIHQTLHHLWFLEYQRVLPQLRLHLPRHHLHHRSQHRLTEIQYRRTEVWKLQYQKEVVVRMKRFGETRSRNPLRPKPPSPPPPPPPLPKKNGVERNTKRHIACQRTKITRAPCRRRIGRVVPRAEKFCDLITADHKVLSEGCESRNNHLYAVVVQDLATQWIHPYPCKTKTSQETQS